MLILASASPRRSDLLTQAGFTFQVHPASINEDPHPNEPPSEYVLRLACEKAESVFRMLAAKLPVLAEDYRVTIEDFILLGADTTVTLGGELLGNSDSEILGKPRDAADAARMLRLLSGRTHSVITGVALTTARDTQSFIEKTLVTMHPLTDQQIADYIRTGEPLDKAGAYAIQGAASKFIASVDGDPFNPAGDYSNVVGLPIPRVIDVLHQLRIAVQ
jgi:septum formation protein